jgi:ADP-ribosylation factor GTPase-activating protein 1
MDAFKAAEIERMRLGGNVSWRRFFEGHEDTKMRGLSWDDATIAERYGGEAGEEWKERLSAKVEGREYVPGEKSVASVSQSASPALSGGGPSTAPTRSGPLSGSAAAAGGRTDSPGPGGKIKVDVDYFAKLGERNASRPADLPPSQGGKYAGFGSSAPSRSQGNEQAGIPGLDDLQKDPMAALSKGFGWFTSTVTKTAKTVNDGFIQPTAKQVCHSTPTPSPTHSRFRTQSCYSNMSLLPQLSESDFAAQARNAAALAAKSAQAGAKTASDGFSRFVEGPSAGGYRPVNTNFDESKRGFWDDLSAAADQRKPAGSAIGTAAMGKGGNKQPPSGNSGKDEWDDW